MSSNWHRTSHDAAVPCTRPGTAVRQRTTSGPWSAGLEAVEPRNGVPDLIPYHYRKGEEERQEWVLEQVRKAQEIAGEKYPDCARW